MTVLTYIQALNQAFIEEMRRDDRVVMWGEDLVSMNGLYGHTAGIFDEFGGDRIRDTPICEQAITGMAIGAALKGLRPIGVFMNAGFSLAAFDGLFLKIGCMHRGLPIVMQATNRRSPGGHGPRHVPRGALHALARLEDRHAIDPVRREGADEDRHPRQRPGHVSRPLGGHVLRLLGRQPVHALPGRDDHVWRQQQEVPDEEYLIPFGQADIKREGSDLTLVTFSFMVHHALAAANALAKEGISVEVVDLRTIVPLDVATMARSAARTRRVLIVHEAMKRGGVAGEIAFRLQEDFPDTVAALKLPIQRLAAMNLPLAGRLDWNLTPSADSIAARAREMVRA